MSGRKITRLPLPETPKEAPSEFHGFVDAIEQHAGDSQVMEAVVSLGRCFDYLTRYFAAVAGATAKGLGLDSGTDVAEDFETARCQLKDRLTILGEKATDPASKLVRSIFYVGATRKTPTPRRHARLLDLGGIPIRGYLELGEWIALTPGEGDLANDSKATRELQRYAPILKEWVTATTNFFIDADVGSINWLSKGSVGFELTIEGVTTSVGPIHLPAALVEQLKKISPAAGSPSSGTDDLPPTEEFPLPDEVKAAIQEESSAALAAPVSASEPVAKPEPVLEPEPVAAKPVPKAEPEPSATEPVDDPVPARIAPEPVAEPAPVVDPESVASEPGSAILPEPSTEPEPIAAEPEPVVEPEPVASEPGSATLPEPSAEPVSVAAEPEPVVEPEPIADVPEPVLEPEPSADVPEPVLEPEPLSDVPEPEPISEPEPVAQATVVPVRAAPSPKPPAEVAPILKRDAYPYVTGPPPEFFDEIDVDPDFPEILTVAITDLNGAIESNDSILIIGQMQRCFDLLVQFFSGLVGSLLMEIDEEALFGFDIEDSRFDLHEKVDVLVTSLSSLEEHWEGNDAANLFWSVFYDTLLPPTDPESVYLHTQLLGVEGVIPEPYIELAELCEKIPGQGALASQQQCRKIAHYYLPILSFWLENAIPLLLATEIDFVEEEDGQALSWAATITGIFLDGTGYGSWIEIAADRWHLPNPELAPVFVGGDAPEMLLPVFEELNLALERADFEQAGLYCRIALDFLLQYFAGCAASLWRQQGQMSEQALELFHPQANLEEKERLLILSLGGISTDSDAGASLGKLFSKGSLQLRALTRKGHPPQMDHIHTWASKRTAVDESELLIYLPLLRSWIGAANPWFAMGEQLFEDPSADGTVEGVVVFGDEFLEMVDPEYVIALGREALELVAPGEPSIVELEEEIDVVDPLTDEVVVTGKLPEIPVLEDGPPILLGHVTRFTEAGEDRESGNAWLGSSVEYLIQYFAGLCGMLLTDEKAALPREVQGFLSPEASLRERERLLVACIEYLKTSANGTVQEGLRDVFIGDGGVYLPHTRYLGASGAGSLNDDEMLLSYWCRLRHQMGELSNEDLHFGMTALHSWLVTAIPFFESCEHYAEEPGTDGLEEIVVVADDYVEMVLPDYAIQTPARGYYEVLYKETDSEARDDVMSFFNEEIRPSLIGPEVVELGGVAEEGDILLGAATDIGVDDLFGAPSFDSGDLFAGTDTIDQGVDVDSMFAPASSAPVEKPTPKPSTPVKPADLTAPTETPKAEQQAPSPSSPEQIRKKKKKSKKQELGSAVLALYKKERLEKARKRAEARARKAEVEPTQISRKLFYRGLKNSKQLGGRGHIGVIELTNIGGGEFKGTVEPAHPCVRIQPTRFEGNEVRLVYQVDPSDMPSTGRKGLIISTQDERVTIRLDQLVPTSWLGERTRQQALMILAAPNLLYGLWLLILFNTLGSSVFGGILSELSKDPEATLSWGIHLKAWFFAMLAILPGATGLPAALKWLFSRLDYSVQEEDRWTLVPLMLLPSVVMTSLIFLTDLWKFSSDIPTGLPMLANRYVFTFATLGLNLLATGLFSLQTTVWWEERSDSKAAKKSFIAFWAITVIVGVVMTFFMW